MLPVFPSRPDYSDSDSDSLRLFIAVPLPPALKALVGQVIPRLRMTLPFQKWVHPEDAHLTLYYIGEVPATAVPALEAKLTRIAARSMPFPLRLEGTGTFGSPRAPSVLWAGLGGSLPALRRLQADVEREAAELGYAPEARAYAPHVTLARRYAGGGGAVAPQAQPEEETGNDVPASSSAALWSAAEWTADRITLYRTRMGRSPMYEPLREFVFFAGG